MITMSDALQKFIDAQEGVYETALGEISAGRKQSHWMWFILPQISGLGHSSTAQYYAIKNLAEAADYLTHPILGRRLVEISEALLKLSTDNATSIFGTPDDLKLRSSMTLFANVEKTHPVFEKVLQKFFHGKPDTKTLELIKTKP